MKNPTADFLPSSIFLVAFLLPVAILAAPNEPTNPEEDLFLGEVPKILTATRLAQSPADSPASVTVIDRKMIEASGAINIPDLFRLVPGFQVGHVSGYWHVVTSHGQSDAYSRRLQVLVDGRSVYTPAFGGVFWSDLALAIEDIDRIEVVRGPNAATHGANSVAATIDIITRHPSQDQNSTVRVARGGLNTSRVMVRQGTSDENSSYRLTAVMRKDDGFPDALDDQTISLFTFRGEHRVNPKDTMDFQFGINQNRRDEGTAASLRDIPRTETVANSYQYLRWRRSKGDAGEWSVRYTHDYFKNSDSYLTAPMSQVLGITFPNFLFPTTPDQPLAVSEDLTTERHNIEFQDVILPSTGVRLVWGAEGRTDRARGNGWFGPGAGPSNHLHRLFSNVEWRFSGDWLLNAGLMYEHTDYTGSEWSPRVAVNYQFLPDQTARVSASRALRTPTLFEQTANGGLVAADGTLISRLYLATHPLQSEKMTSYEVGYLGEFRDAALTADIKLFREELSDVISVVRDDSIANPIPYTPPFNAPVPYTFQNEGESRTDGVELQLNWRPAARTRFVYAHAYAHQEGYALERLAGGVPTYAATNASTPVSTRSLLAIHELLPRLEGSLAYYRVSNMKFFGGDQTGGFRTADARLAYQFSGSEWRGELALVGQNLLGEFFDFDETTSAKTYFGRRYLMTLGLTFH